MAGIPDEVGRVFLTRQSVKLPFYQIHRIGTTLSGQELYQFQPRLLGSRDIMDDRLPDP
jgi:hypothetical protein